MEICLEDVLVSCIVLARLETSLSYQSDTVGSIDSFHRQTVTSAKEG
jgi:hypothetical protein